MKKRIGIGGNLRFTNDATFSNYGRAYVNNDYVEAVVAAGAVPMILPLVPDREIVRAELEGIGGLVITGGWDVNPLLWGEEPHVRLGDTLEVRDTYDTMLIEEARRMDIPIFGICRGIQIINVVCGGTLWQDVVTECPTAFVRHWQPHHADQATHSVRTEPDSILRRIFGERHLVNSFHHMAVKKPAPGFRVTAYAADGTIEGLESTEGSRVFAVQWHPEMMHRKDSEMLALFRELMRDS